METQADAAPEPALPKSDYSLMDSLCQFLYSDEEPLSILCGYFLKVMSQLLDKQKMATLEYLLIHQEGKIFNGLLRHIDQHSIASLLQVLVEQQIQTQKKDRWENPSISENSDFDSNQEDETELTKEQRQMQTVLKEKSTMVINTLIKQLSPKNKDDVHAAINASTVLNEFSENEAFFQILTQPSVVRNIVNVVCTIDANKQN